jgi:hypothetical protein
MLTITGDIQIIDAQVELDRMAKPENEDKYTYEDILETRKDRSKKARIYIWPVNETLCDNLINRHCRPVAMYRKDILPTVLGLIGGTSAHWDQKAGCSCGCSPGFVVDDVYGLEVHVQVSEMPDDAGPATKAGGPQGAGA